MRRAGLDEAQAGIEIARRNISNLRYADDTTLMVVKVKRQKVKMAEGEEELKSLLMKMKEKCEKIDLTLNIQKQRSWHPAPSFHGK